MAVKLTDDQFETVKVMVGLMGNFADQLYHIMENHGLDKVKGFQVVLTVDPQFDFVTKQIEIGTNLRSDSGYVSLTKGKGEDKYAPTGKNSAEYECLFASETTRSRMEKVLHREKPLPPDGLWVGDSRYDPPVDSREWDLNDSLS